MGNQQNKQHPQDLNIEVVSRRQFLWLSGASTMGLFLAACGANGGTQNTPQPGQNPLQIPELLDSRATPEMELVLQNGSHEFYAGVKSETKGFNGGYLGPTIRLYDGLDTTITFTNNIGEPTTVHGHGLHVNGDIDGGPQSRIEPGESWKITIPVRQEAGTSWYHPHLMGTSAHHVHAGLAGMYLIEDENSQALDLPKEYGVNDIPLVVQDRSFTDGKMNHYAVTEDEIKSGLREDTLVVNGTVDAYHLVPQGWVRLRLLNGSNARFYRFHFGNNVSFFKIATEGGFLNQGVFAHDLEKVQSKIELNSAKVVMQTVSSSFSHGLSTLRLPSGVEFIVVLDEILVGVVGDRLGEVRVDELANAGEIYAKLKVVQNLVALGVEDTLTVAAAFRSSQLNPFGSGGS